MLVVCINNGGYKVSLTVGKYYNVEAIEQICSKDMYVLMDDDQDYYYLYPPSWFEIVEGDASKLPRW